MDEEFPYDLGAYDVVNMLYELHQLGYQNLRLFTMLSGTGLCMRTCITTKSNLIEDGFHCESHDSDVWWPHSSADNTKYKGSISELAEAFIRQYPELCRNGRGSDPAYTMWLRSVMPLLFNGQYPDMDYIGAEEHRLKQFRVGQISIPFPPK